jgi:flavin-dependent dehydrogenase
MTTFGASATRDVEVDVVVAGGGPVGLGAALLATRAGLRTLVLEPRSSPHDKACGEGLMPGALAALAALGVDPPGHRLAGIAYLAADGSRTARARFRDGPGRGVRRTALAGALSDAVVSAGIPREQVGARGVRQVAGTVQVSGISARWLLAADGLHSPLRRELGLEMPARGSARYGLRQHFRCEPWSDFVEVHWAADAEAYVTPVGPDLVGVAILTSVRGRHMGEWLASFPQLRRRLGTAEAVTGELGAGPLRQRTRRRVAGRVLFVGDAAGYVDALTGEGISVGLAQAAVAVDCIREGQPDRYEARWRAVTRGYRVLTNAVLLGAGRPTTRRALVPAAVALPWLFDAAVDALASP